MKKIKVIAGQNLADIAVQIYGDVRAVILIAKTNDVAITEALIPGQELVLPVSEFTKVDILNSFLPGKKIATAQAVKVATGSDFLLPNILPLSL